MGIGQSVKFRQGTQEQYNTLKETEALEENALYFTTDTHRLFLGENEISTAIRVSGIDDGSDDCVFPSAYQPDSFATVTNELNTGEIRLGSAATMNVLKQYGPGEYSMPRGYGNKYVPSAAAVYSLIEQLGGITVGDDQHSQSGYISWDMISERSQKDELHRYFGPTTTIPAEYVATPGDRGSSAQPVEIHNGDYYIVYEAIENVEDETTGENTTVKKNKFLPIFQSMDVPLFSFVHPDNMTDSTVHAGIVPPPRAGDRDSVLTGRGKWRHLHEFLVGQTTGLYLAPDNIPAQGAGEYDQIDDTQTDFGADYIRVEVDGDALETQGIFIVTIDQDYTYTPTSASDQKTFKLRLRLKNRGYDEDNPSAAPYYIYKTLPLLQDGVGMQFLPEGTWLFKTTSGNSFVAELVGKMTQTSADYLLSTAYKNGNRNLDIQLKDNDTIVSRAEVPVMIGTPSHGGGEGKTGLVPAPSYGDNTRFLRGDGRWETPTFMPYVTASTMETATYYDNGPHRFSQITMTSGENLLGYQYFVATFPQDYLLEEGNERITFLSVSSTASMPIFPLNKGENIAFIPKGTWMWAKTNNYQQYELVGSFGSEWRNI